MRLEPRADHRFTLEHYGMSTPEMARRLARLGGLASVNPYYLYARSEFNAPYVGSDRAYTAARLRTLVDAGVPTSLHTDSPVAPPVPLEEVWIAVNRFGLSGKVRGPEERISVDQALRMVTIDAAFTLGVEDKVGSIAPGQVRRLRRARAGSLRGAEGEDPQHQGLGHRRRRQDLPGQRDPAAVNAPGASEGIPSGVGRSRGARPLRRRIGGARCWLTTTRSAGPRFASGTGALGFNWPACFFGSSWCLWRKQYLLAIGIYVGEAACAFALSVGYALGRAHVLEPDDPVLGILPYLALPIVRIPLGAVANRVYLERARKVILSARSLATRSERLEQIRSNGGTSPLALTAGVLVNLVAIVWSRLHAA